MALSRRFICVIGLALFLHFREMRIEVLELNSAAGHYVVAQVDFEFPDYETGIVLKQQAMADIGAIYQIDDKEVRDVRYELEDLLVHSKEWRQAAPTARFEEMYKAADALETILLEARFTDPRTMQIVQELRLPENSYLEFLPDAELANLPSTFWNWTTRQMGDNRQLHEEAIAYVIRTFQGKSGPWSKISPSNTL